MEEQLKKLLENSYSPYSNFRVAAIALMKDGTMFKGVNVENASYGATICAERSAILGAISTGYKRHDFEKLYVMVDSDQISSCCFICRQVISEMYEPNKEIILMNNKGEKETYKVSDLCPKPFLDGDLI